MTILAADLEVCAQRLPISNAYAAQNLPVVAALELEPLCQQRLVLPHSAERMLRCNS
jgi:hypothetical protein